MDENAQTRFPKPPASLVAMYALMICGLIGGVFVLCVRTGSRNGIDLGTTLAVATPVFIVVGLIPTLVVHHALFRFSNGASVVIVAVACIGAVLALNNCIGAAWRLYESGWTARAAEELVPAGLFVGVAGIGLWFGWLLMRWRRHVAAEETESVYDDSE